MSDDIRFNFEEVENMIMLLKQTTSQLEETTGRMRSVATEMYDGALLGRAGERFAEAINGNFSARVAALQEAVEEQAAFVEREREQIISVMSENAGRFS